MKRRLQNVNFIKQGIPDIDPALQVQFYWLHRSCL